MAGAEPAPERRRDRLRARVRRYTTVPFAVRTSDLPVRIASAVVMLLLAGTAFALGGAWFAGFVAVVALATFAEFVLLTIKATTNVPYRMAGLIAGALYIGVAALSLIGLPPALIVFTVVVVILTDTCAYFVGRAVGGPKIAPRISPSKTWAGLLGGMVGAALWTALATAYFGFLLSGLSGARSDLAGSLLSSQTLIALAIGAGLAVAAQAGDFFESWLKRKAGVKDSSRLIPGHGGVFDRVDGLLPVAIVVGAVWEYAR